MDKFHFLAVLVKGGWASFRLPVICIIPGSELQETPATPCYPGTPQLPWSLHYPCPIARASVQSPAEGYMRGRGQVDGGSLH